MIRRQVRGPAIGLVVMGILNWIGIPLIVMVMAYWAAGRNAEKSLLSWLPLQAGAEIRRQLRTALRLIEDRLAMSD